MAQQAGPSTGFQSPSDLLLPGLSQQNLPCATSRLLGAGHLNKKTSQLPLGSCRVAAFEHLIGRSRPLGSLLAIFQSSVQLLTSYPASSRFSAAASVIRVS